MYAEDSILQGVATSHGAFCTDRAFYIQTIAKEYRGRDSRVGYSTRNVSFRGSHARILSGYAASRRRTRRSSRSGEGGLLHSSPLSCRLHSWNGADKQRRDKTRPKSKLAEDVSSDEHASYAHATENTAHPSTCPTSHSSPRPSSPCAAPMP